MLPVIDAMLAPPAQAGQVFDLPLPISDLHMVQVQPRFYTTSYALRALAINGNEATAKTIVELFEQGCFHPMETREIAHVVFRSAPAWARQLIKDYAGSDSFERRRLACELLNTVKRPTEDEGE